jgi:ribose transport system ATP-binding protein
MKPILELIKITKNFGDDFFLEDVSLDLYPGEVHVIIGENGSGKSAILKIVSGLVPPAQGEIRVDGELVHFSDIGAAKKAGILYRPQEPQLFDNLSVAENLYFDELPHSIIGSLQVYQLRYDAKNLLHNLGIAIDPQKVVRTLGYAERQLLEAAKACVKKWKIVAFDEPTAALAEPERAILFAIVQRLKAQGVGVLYVSHRLDEIQKVGDRLSVVRQGRIIDTRPVKNLDREVLVKMMTGRLLTERYPRFANRQGKPVLEARDIRSGDILRGVSFSLRRGEILGITGLMGSGRTRLAQCLFGAVEPNGGQIYLNGKAVNFRNPQEALTQGLALIPEDRMENSILHRQDLVLNLTVASLNRYNKITGLDPKKMFKLVRNYSSRMGLRPGHPNDYPDSYSGGNQQKVSVARWLAKRAQIYIMDEPTRGIDVASKIDVYNAIADIAAKGGSVIFISSDIEEILGMCDRILVLTGGKIVCDLPRLKASQEIILEYATAD